MTCPRIHRRHQSQDLFQVGFAKLKSLFHALISTLFHSAASSVYEAQTSKESEIVNLHHLEFAGNHLYHSPLFPALLKLARMDQTLINTGPLFLQFLNIIRECLANIV